MSTLRYAAAGLAALGLTGAAQPGLAASACPKGGFSTPACENAIRVALQRSDDLHSCLQIMDDEYNGRTGNGVGRGANYDAQLAYCKAIFSQLAQAFGPNGPYSVNSASGDIAVGSPQAAVLEAQAFFARK